MSLTILFFGNPRNAVPSLDALLESKHTVIGVVTAPDRPRGRGMRVASTAVKQRALDAGVPTMEFESLRDPHVTEQLEAAGADVFVVVAYGLILPKEVLQIPGRGCFNVHFSMLPKLRGPAPVEWALIEGHGTTGVSVMLMDEGVDTGPVLARAEEIILPEDTGGSLADRLSVLGARLLVTCMDGVEGGTAVPKAQGPEEATLAPRLSTDDARIDWTLDAQAIVRRVRAFDPRPGAWTTRGGKRLKVWRASVVPGRAEPGSLSVGEDGSPVVGAGLGVLVLGEVQPEGRPRMKGADYLRGHPPAGPEVLR